MLLDDYSTDKVYFSDLLKSKKYLKFSKELFKILDNHNVKYELISNTKDIWMRDYMPIQKDDGNFIRYLHNPDYLVGYEELKTNPKTASSFLDSKNIIDINLNLDGGNIVRAKDKIICTDKIFKANVNWSKDNIIDLLKTLLDISELIIIPKQPYDMTGHADGLVRFIDDSRVLVIPCQKDEKSFHKRLITSLKKHHLEVITLPSRGYYKEQKSAEWIPYINYMQVGDLIILPVVGSKVDREVLNFFKEHFTKCHIEYLDATAIIEQGGALNCISWNISEGIKCHT